MSIQKRGNKWRAVLRPKGQKAITKTFKTKKEAEKFHAEKLLELANNTQETHKGASPRITLADFIRKINPTERPSNRTKFNKFYHINQLAEIELAGLYLDDIELKHTLAFVFERKGENLSPSTIIKDLTRLSSIYKQAEDLGYAVASANPFSVGKIRKHTELNPPHHRERRLSDLEETQILFELGYSYNMAYDLRKTAHETILFIQLALETGMRLSEVLTLKKSQIFLNRSELVLNQTKNGERRWVPLSTKAKKILKILLERKGDRLFQKTPSAIQYEFKKICKKLEIKNLTIHDLRHEATHRLTKTLNVLEVAKILGHKDIKNLMTYYNPTSAEIAEKIDSINADFLNIKETQNGNK